MRRRLGVQVEPPPQRELDLDPPSVECLAFIAKKVEQQEWRARRVCATTISRPLFDALTAMRRAIAARRNYEPPTGTVSDE